MVDKKADKKFEQIVQKFEPQSKLLRIWELKGGISAQVTALEIEQPDGHTKKMIVRQHGEVDLKHNPHIAADEFELLHLLHSVGLAAPTPYYLDQSCEIFPTPYIVIEYIEGEPIFESKNVAAHLGQGDAREAHTLPDSQICAAQPDQGDASVPTHHPNSPRPYATIFSLPISFGMFS